MKIFYSLSLLLLCIGCRHPSSLQTEKECQSLLDQKEYFRLRRIMALHGQDLSPEKNLYFSACIDNVFNMNAASVRKIQELFDNYDRLLTDSIKARLFLLEEDNYFKTYEYARAARAEQEMIDHYRN